MKRAFDLGIDIKNLEDMDIMEELRKRGCDLLEMEDNKEEDNKEGGEDKDMEAGESMNGEEGVEGKETEKANGHSEKMDLNDEAKGEAEDQEMEGAISFALFCTLVLLFIYAISYKILSRFNNFDDHILPLNISTGTHDSSVY